MGLTKRDVTEQHCINCTALYEPEWFGIVVFILDYQKIDKGLENAKQCQVYPFLGDEVGKIDYQDKSILNYCWPDDTQLLKNLRFFLHPLGTPPTSLKQSYFELGS